MLSKRIKKIEESGIRKVFEMASQNKGELLDFSIGQPHFKTPEKLKNALCKASQDNYNHYTSTKGLEGLRKKIIDKLKKQNKINAKEEEVMITNGVSGGIFLSFAVLLDQGDEVILPDPYFVLYKQILDFFGIKTVFLDTYPDFHINPDKLKELITTKTKAVIINSPNNPTGMVYEKEELEEVVQIAQENDLFIFSDEIYEKFDFDNRFFSIGSIYDKTITLNGFSKSHLVTGWRVGYLHGPASVIEAMNKLQQYTFVCAPAIGQQAIFSEWDVDLSSYVSQYRSNRDYLVSNLDSKFKFVDPEGSYYAFIKNPQGMKDFSKKLIENKVLVVPGKVFSKRKGYFRLSFATEQKKLEKGIDILNKIVK